MPKRPPGDKIKALTIAELAGSRTAAEHVGVSQRVVQKWVKEGHSDSEVAGMIRDAVSRAQQEWVYEASGLVVDLTATIRASVARIGESGATLTPAQIRDLSVSLGILRDKLDAGRGPSARYSYSQSYEATTESKGPGPIVAKLLAQMRETRTEQNECACQLK